MTKRRRRAMARGELVVLFAALFFLFMLLVLILREIRPHGGPTCTNNLYELGIALKMYAADNNRYPGYRQHIGAPIDADVSWCVAILPQLGHNDIYDQYRVPVSPPRRPANLANIQLLQCPQDEQEYDRGPWLSYVINGGQSDTIEAQPSVPTSQRRAQGICHDLTLPEGQEMYVDDGYIQKYDGTSKTLLLSENRGAFQWTSPEEYRLCFLWAKGETSATRAPINQDDFAEKNDSACQASGPNQARLSGSHPGGVLALFADGHVQFLSEDMDNQVYRYVCTPRGDKADDTPTQMLAMPWNDLEF